MKTRLTKPARSSRNGSPRTLSQGTQNPSITNANGNGKAPAARRYFAPIEDEEGWPPELSDYNKRFTGVLDKIKRRHDGVVPTVGTKDTRL